MKLLLLYCEWFSYSSHKYPAFSHNFHPHLINITFAFLPLIIDHFFTKICPGVIILFYKKNRLFCVRVTERLDAGRTRNSLMFERWKCWWAPRRSKMFLLALLRHFWSSVYYSSARRVVIRSSTAPAVATLLPRKLVEWWSRRWWYFKNTSAKAE